MTVILRTVLCVMLISPFWLEPSQGGYVPTNGFVPDDRTAIAIAEAVLLPIYGSKVVDGEKPFHATLKAGVWTIEGTLPKGLNGGVAVVRLSKQDGQIISVIHGK